MKITIADSHKKFDNIEAYKKAFDNVSFVNHAYEATSDTEILSISHSKIGIATLDRWPNLKLITVRGSGCDSVNISECTSRGIWVTNTTTPRASRSVAEFTIMQILNGVRRKSVIDNYVSKGARSFKNMPLAIGELLYGKTVAIVGYGMIGKLVGEMLDSFFVKVNVIHTTGVTSVNELKGVEHADVVTIHCPLHNNLKWLFNKDFFNMCKKGVVFVNTARGKLVNSIDLLDALNKKQVGYAALDVLSGDEDTVEGIKKLNYTDITPHVAFYTNEHRISITDQNIKNIQHFITNKRPIWTINKVAVKGHQTTIL